VTVTVKSMTAAKGACSARMGPKIKIGKASPAFRRAEASSKEVTPNIAAPWASKIFAQASIPNP